jgi:hypothetical protein
MNYILKLVGKATADIETVGRVIREHHGKVIDDSMMPKTALVNVADSEIDSVQGQLEEYHIYPEKQFGLPNNQHIIKK